MGKVDADDVVSILEYFKELEDPRSTVNRRHLLVARIWGGTHLGPRIWGHPTFCLKSGNPSIETRPLVSFAPPCG